MADKQPSPSWTDVELFPFQAVFEKNGMGNFCLYGPYLCAHQVTAYSTSVNFCLAEKRLSPRWTDVELFLLHAVFEKIGRGNLFLCGPYLLAHRVTAYSASVNFCRTKFEVPASVWPRNG